MSDTMLLGVLRMPVDENDPLCMAQFVQKARQAADRIESDANEITRLQSEVERLRGRCEELESALTPFAEEAEYMPDYAVDIHLNYIMDDAEVLERASFTAENIHTAAQRLRQQAAEIEGGE